MIPLHRRLEYARGYIGLGMLKEAAQELAPIDPTAARSPEVVRVYVDYYMESKEWDKVVAVAPVVCEASPEDDGAWIAWAYACRELGQVSEAQAVLRRAEPRHGETCAVLHYNLACYACLLGDMDEARRRLVRAFAMNADWKAEALQDRDLQAMWSEIEAIG